MTMTEETPKQPWQSVMRRRHADAVACGRETEAPIKPPTFLGRCVGAWRGLALGWSVGRGGLLAYGEVCSLAAQDRGRQLRRLLAEAIHFKAEEAIAETVVTQRFAESFKQAFYACLAEKKCPACRTVESSVRIGEGPLQVGASMSVGSLKVGHVWVNYRCGACGHRFNNQEPMTETIASAVNRS